MKPDYFTRHAQERFGERFPELLKPGFTLTKVMSDTLSKATLERGFLNNTQRLVWMLEKHGDYNFDFWLADKVVFCCREGRVITVIHRDDMGMKKMFGGTNSGFRKKASA